MRPLVQNGFISYGANTTLTSSYLFRNSHATTMGHIKRGDLETAIVLVPSPEEIKAMSEKMNPVLNKKIANSKQIRTLEKLRETLLPVLMSGEVRIQCDEELIA